MNQSQSLLRRTRLARLSFALLVIILTGGCASQSANLTDAKADPWEPFNRKIYTFNDGFDRVLMKPIAKGYDAIMPDAPQRGVRNFFRNLKFPMTFLNLILQGKFEDSLTATGRFVMNSTVGLLGFFDVATREGVPEFDEDFGQTMAKWGWKDSRYLVVPFFGPHTMRDLGGRVADSYTSPVSYMVREHDEYRPLILDIISLRASLLPFDQDLKEANDPYALMRDAYLQNREFKIYDGEPPSPDYDALLEEENLGSE
jgi:phospholipid-binding lipoprotein MlaA